MLRLLLFSLREASHHMCCAVHTESLATLAPHTTTTPYVTTYCVHSACVREGGREGEGKRERMGEKEREREREREIIDAG